MLTQAHAAPGEGLDAFFKARGVAVVGASDDITKIGGRPVAVSANVAGITATRSLLHPLFQAGFLGAPSFGIEIYEPATTRLLSGLLTLHDVLHEGAPGAALDPSGAGPSDVAERARADVAGDPRRDALAGLGPGADHPRRCAARSR